MIIIEKSINKLDEIREMIMQINELNYRVPQSILSDATIGQHIRHLIEFYGCIIKGYSENKVSYDERKRDFLLETDIHYTIKEIDKMKQFLLENKKDKVLEFKGNYSASNGDSMLITTSYYRELVYALDHAIHHQALIKIGLNQLGVEVEEYFGVAPSTIRYRKSCAQ